ATLTGPGGKKITLANDSESQGVHTFGWNGTDGSSPAAEGKWTFTVTGKDDRNVTTSAARTFSLDDTLSSLAVSAGRNRLTTPSVRLTRPAAVLAQIERPNGVPVATLQRGKRAAGQEHVVWRGRIDGRRASGGRYQVAVQATSSVGTSSLVAGFSLRAHKRK